jgi:predicted nucleic acid-binding protein
LITALDTNVLLDLLIPNARFMADSKKALEESHGEGSLILCEAVWAELASQFESREEVETFLRDTGIQLVPATATALYGASCAWRQYSERRKDGVVCTVCGSVQRSATCEECREPLRARQHIVSDFLIGGHAQVLSDRLLTRDRGFYSTYFADLPLFS